MPFKINISEKSGKTFKLESESEELIEKEIRHNISGKDISPDLEGYEFEITGASDKSGFPVMENVEGIGLKKVLLGYGKGMHIKPKGDKKKGTKPKGLRLRKTVRGKIISSAISQINLKVVKEGSKKLEEIFPEQNKSKEPEKKPETPKTETAPAVEPKKEETKAETPKTEEKVVEKKKEEKKE